ncbi:Uncharacterized protein SCF082_LOCUS14219 [Durusdinium trenchii]|uniref:Uncharacterized protein n=1 Tax=Durusdinium trenchii TaxID=1381693 RepID=A0ABP0JWB5_9DINO
MAACDLDGLATEWESNKEVREFVRVKNCLFAPALRCAEPECNVACAERNYEQLAPLAKRLRLPDGHVGQVMVPHVAREKAREALEKDSTKKPIVVLESQPFGNDSSETQPLPTAEMNLLAETFSEVDPTIPSVLRRAQHALKPDKSEAKDDEAKGNEAKDVEAKDDEVEGDEARDDEDDKAKRRPAPKAKGRPREEPQATDMDQTKDDAKPEVVVSPKDDAKGEVVVPPSDAKAKDDVAKEHDDHPKQKVPRKTRAQRVGDTTQDSAGSEPVKRANKRRKTTQAETAKDSHDETAKDSAKAVATEGDPKEANGHNVAGEDQAEGGKPKEAPKKRARNPEAQSFARRVIPNTAFGQAKWHALRGQFNEKIRLSLRHYSAHEDLWFTKNLLDKFWKFATQLWESQEAEVIEGNVNDMASAAAEKLPLQRWPSLSLLAGLALIVGWDHAVAMGDQQHGWCLGTGAAAFQHAALASTGMRSVGCASSGLLVDGPLWSVDHEEARMLEQLSQYPVLRPLPGEMQLTQLLVQPLVMLKLKLKLWSYVKSVIEYCEKPGNEKDRYNPKIRKYYVIYGEEEDDISENEEEHKHEETGEAAEDLSFRMLGPEDPDQSEVDDEEEKEAEQVNSAAKEHQKFVTFAQSLLSRSTKLADLVGQLEIEIGDKGSVLSLEQSIEILNEQYAACEIVKLDTDGLRDPSTQEVEKQGFLRKIREQIRSTTSACSKITPTELSENDEDQVLAGYAQLIANGAGVPNCGDLQCLADQFDADSSSFDWGLTRDFGLLNRCMRMPRQEVETNPNVSVAMREFSNIKDNDAEIGVRRVLLKYGMTVPVEISTVDLGEAKHLQKFPWVKLSDWMRYLVQVGLLERQMVGVATTCKMKGVLQEFWKRYRALDGEHKVFQLEREGRVTLDSVIPFYSHSDEGRTTRDAPLWVLNVQGVIGRGSVRYVALNKHRLPLVQNAQGLNYMGNTWGTHFLIGSMMKKVATPDALSKFLSAFAEDCKFLLEQGINHGADKVFFIHLAHKGDMPALAKIAKFTRTFGHAPKAKASRKPSRGVCWQCLGGQEEDRAAHRVAVPYEDVSMAPIWESTMFTELPWEVRPTILEGLDLTDRMAADFFKADLFHNLHLGALKSFASSAIVSLVEADPPLPEFAGLTSVEKKFDLLSQMYQRFFADRKRRPWISELTRDLVCWPQSSAVPAAKWNKGMATVEIMRFIDWFAANYLSSSDAAASKAINVAVTHLYESGLWLRDLEARRVAKWLFCFLAHYALLAKLTLERGKRRYPIYPKLHMVCHTAVALDRNAATCQWQLSPLATACQQNEDFIGKPSKVSRDCNVRQVHRTLIWRSMIKVIDPMRKAGKDQRAMDSYPDL